MAPTSPTASTCQDEIILRSAEEINTHLEFLEALATSLQSRIQETKAAKALADKAEQAQILLPIRTILVAVGDKETPAQQNAAQQVDNTSKGSSTTGCPGLTDASETFNTVSGGDSANAARTEFMRLWSLHKNNNKTQNRETEPDATATNSANKYSSLMSFLRQFGAQIRATNAQAYAIRHFQYMSYKGDVSDDQLTEVIKYMHSSDGMPTITSEISTTIAITARPRHIDEDGAASVHSGQSSISAISIRAMAAVSICMNQRVNQPNEEPQYPSFEQSHVPLYEYSEQDRELERAYRKEVNNMNHAHARPAAPEPQPSLIPVVKCTKGEAGECDICEQSLEHERILEKWKSTHAAGVEEEYPGDHCDRYDEYHRDRQVDAAVLHHQHLMDEANIEDIESRPNSPPKLSSLAITARLRNARNDMDWELMWLGQGIESLDDHSMQSVDSDASVVLKLANSRANGIIADFNVICGQLRTIHGLHHCPPGPTATVPRSPNHPEHPDAENLLRALKRLTRDKRAALSTLRVQRQRWEEDNIYIAEAFEEELTRKHTVEQPEIPNAHARAGSSDPATYMQSATPAASPASIENPSTSNNADHASIEPPEGSGSGVHPHAETHSSPCTAPGHDEITESGVRRASERLAPTTTSATLHGNSPVESGVGRPGDGPECRPSAHPHAAHQKGAGKTVMWESDHSTSERSGDSKNSLETISEEMWELWNHHIEETQTREEARGCDILSPGSWRRHAQEFVRKQGVLILSGGMREDARALLAHLTAERRLLPLEMLKIASDLDTYQPTADRWVRQMTNNPVLMTTTDTDSHQRTRAGNQHVGNESEDDENAPTLAELRETATAKKVIRAREEQEDRTYSSRVQPTAGDKRATRSDSAAGKTLQPSAAAVEQTIEQLTVDTPPHSKKASSEELRQVLTQSWRRSPPTSPETTGQSTLLSHQARGLVSRPSGHKKPITKDNWDPAGHKFIGMMRVIPPDFGPAVRVTNTATGATQRSSLRVRANTTQQEITAENAVPQGDNGAYRERDLRTPTADSALKTEHTQRRPTAQQIESTLTACHAARAACAAAERKIAKIDTKATSISAADTYGETIAQMSRWTEQLSTAATAAQRRYRNILWRRKFVARIAAKKARADRKATGESEPPAEKHETRTESRLTSILQHRTAPPQRRQHQPHYLPRGLIRHLSQNPDQLTALMEAMSVTPCHQIDNLPTGSRAITESENADNSLYTNHTRHHVPRHTKGQARPQSQFEG